MGRVCTFLAFCLSLSACSPTVSLPPLAEGDVILAFGDSLTYGTGAEASESYPSILAKITGLRVVRSGVPGEVSAAGLARLPRVLAEHQPALVVLLHGGNDVLRRQSEAQLERNLRSMVQACRNAGASVLLISVPGRSVLLRELELYADVASSEGAGLLEGILPRLLKTPELKSDPVHLNAAGYRQLAEAVRLRLRELDALGTL